METTIVCDICKRRLASHTCRLCGRRICEKDFDEIRGTCIACSHGRTGESYKKAQKSHKVRG